MICPRCSVGEISPKTQVCAVCGLSAASPVVVQGPVADEVQETVQAELVGRFELLVLLRHTKRADLYLARDVPDDREVMLRLLPMPGPVSVSILRQFERAASVAQALRHPHVVPIAKFGVSSSMLWYSLDAPKGTTLAASLEERGPMDLPACLDLLEQLASGLDYIHRSGIVHGALHPGSIYLGNEGWARVSDVGVAYDVARAAGPGSPWVELLSPRYAAPEQSLRRLAGPAADQYALAAVAYDCLSGLPEDPTDRDENETVETSPRERIDLPEHVLAALVRARQDDPQARFSTVLDFVSVLQGGGVRASAPRLPGPSQPAQTSTRVLLPDTPEPPPPRRHVARRWIVAGTVMVLLAVAGVVAKMMMSGSDTPRWEVGIARPPPAPVTRTDRPDSVEVPAPAAPAVQPTVEAPPPRPAPLRPGTLFVNATPWGVLYLDGRRIGNTPRANIPVAAGTHVLRVVRDGYEPFEQRIRVRPGEEYRLTDIVLSPIQPR